MKTMRSKITALLLVSVAAVVAAQSASAADLPMKPIYKAPAAIVAWDWTGPYVGAYVGVGVSKSRGHDPAGTRRCTAGDIEHTGYGFTGGGMLGYNYQLNWGILGQKFVVGVEGDIGYFDTSTTELSIGTTSGLTYNTKTPWLATARAPRRPDRRPELQLRHRRFRRAHVRDSNQIRTTGGLTVSSSKTETGWVIGTRRRDHARRRLVGKDRIPLHQRRQRRHADQSEHILQFIDRPARVLHPALWHELSVRRRQERPAAADQLERPLCRRRVRRRGRERSRHRSRRHADTVAARSATTAPAATPAARSAGTG